MAFPDDAGLAIGTTGGSTIDDVAASIARKLGGDDRPRDEHGRFLSSGDSKGGETAESGEDPETTETEEDDESKAAAETDEGEEQTEDQGQPQTFAVKVRGEEVKVTLDELLKGYSREADYTRDKQALSSEKATWESVREQTLKAERDALAAEREQAKQVLQGWEQFIQTQFGNKEYWDNLHQQDPGRWSAEQLRLERQLRDVQTQAEKLRKEEEAKSAAAITAHRDSEFRKLLTAIPEWNDQAKLNEGYQKIAEYAVKVRGYKPEDLGALADDHKLALVLKDAAAFHALEQKTPEIAPKPKDIKPAKPGAVSHTPPKVTQTRKTAERFAQTGRTDDLADHLARKFNLSG